ncbi:hypothetical protein G7072_18955 [Nocardioides sp. HDW12B]|uniref:sensor histidine kinase n=1 Tax=Nocardioides sp. HDW12B TaxID=2714939 RepID=UPI001407B320|nr:histidine kinase [Nocardioides sp. HDW12B]QIK68139.1 hypothetical protein G7072_18955 [Nocardioides sp. HDW12B]
MPTTTHDGPDRVAEEVRWAERSRLPATVLASVGAAVSFLALFELAVGSTVLVDLGPSWAPTTALTALLGLTTSAGLLLWRGGDGADRPWPAAAFALTGVLVLVALGERVAGHAVLGDLLAVEAGDRATVDEQTSLVVVVSFGLLALGGLALTRRWTVPAQVAAFLALTIGLASAAAYAFGAEPVEGSDAPAMMTVVATVLVVALAQSLLYAIPGSLAQWSTYGRDSGARLQRSVPIIALVVVPLIGAAMLAGLRSGWLDPGAATALVVTTGLGLALVLSAWVGLQFRAVEEERAALLRENQRVNAELEDRVRLRSHEVNRQRTKLALLEERDRIARDLHDRVIQRIFAAGLQIGALSRTVAKVAEGADASRLPGQLDVIAGELDLAIRELRNSIFQLTSIDDHQDLEQVVHDIATRSSRILGFMPRISVAGELGGVRSDLAADLASAIQEGLSNVARHARASAAQVSLEGTPQEFVVRITDDGVGLPDPLPRSSGISNLMNRARGLGGSATWEPNPTGGTVFTWRVSRDGTAGEFYGNDVAVGSDGP